MGLKEDTRRFKQIGEEKREDLEDFIKRGQMGEDIKIPIKIVELPSFKYHKLDMGGVGQGEGDVGEPVDDGQQGDDEGEGDEAGEGSEGHNYYEMDPEEFAEELDERLGLDLEPKGKQVERKTEGAYTDTALQGPESTLDVDYFFKQALKRTLSLNFDEEYLREVLKVKGIGPKRAFNWARKNNIPVQKSWLDHEYEDIPNDEKDKYDSIDDIDRERKESHELVEADDISLREEDKRYRYPSVVKEKKENAVIVNIRDVSGSMRQSKRELVERIFTPIDWYLQGKYENAEFIYIAHDSEAWEVERDDFFGIKSGGGTQISSAYELAQEILEEHYPWSEWNRFVFAAGDGENYSNDTKNNVIPLMEEINANKHAYVETRPSSGLSSSHGEILEDYFSEGDNVTVTTVKSKEDIIPAIEDILSEEGDENE